MRLNGHQHSNIHCYTHTFVVEISSIARVGGELFSATEEDGLIVLHLIAEQNGDQTLGVDYKANLHLHNRRSQECMIILIRYSGYNIYVSGTHTSLHTCTHTHAHTYIRYTHRHAFAHPCTHAHTHTTSVPALHHQYMH